ncbi:conserved protein of unknown function [Methylacidimicrobium sp. AP8]|uniref:hypothetical protein n=1 Tax=Methylacidimicrobium sp. AP8 TaxID=2730359 RepID=UPI0018BFC8F5|nr:hypothetical protein [Methylacidimicrobium sp. AP8]CAB4243758.1 conserved protein of unknown function [Methylacidimicrobium sp. AP8]
MATWTLWREIPDEWVHEILLAVRDSDKRLYRVAIELTSRRLGIRQGKLLEMPKAQRHQLARRVLSLPQSEEISSHLFTCWLVHTRAPMLCAWLDALEIPHDGRGVVEKFGEEPSPEKLREALERLLACFPRLDVAIYLRLFNEIDEVGWEGLEEILSGDERLRIGRESTEAAEARG